MSLIGDILKKAFVGAVALEIKGEMRKHVRKGIKSVKEAYNTQQEKNRKEKMLTEMSPDDQKALQSKALHENPAAPDNIGKFTQEILESSDEE